jgi:hypothetical protein
MLKLNSIKADLEVERNGQFVEIPDWEGVSLGVRSLELPAYKIAIDLTLQKYARIYKGKSAPPDVRESDIGKLLAKHILFGWNGIEPDYTSDVAEEFLSTPAGRELAKQVVWAAGQVAAVDAEFVEDASKNSVRPSATI